jgi:predicted nicotinamide N-methyase
MYRFRDDVAVATGPADTNDSPGAKNIFDNLPAFRMLQFGALDELARYLASMPEDVKNEDVLKWWYEHKHVYPNLH